MTTIDVEEDVLVTKSANGSKIKAQLINPPDRMGWDNEGYGPQLKLFYFFFNKRCCYDKFVLQISNAV